MSSWTSRANLNHARGFSSVTRLLNGKMLVAGGQDNSGAITTCELYDPNANTWTDTGSLLTAQYAHDAVLLGNGQVLVIGGQNGGGVVQSAELYNPNTGLWSFTATPHFPATCYAAWTLPSGKILISSGMGPGFVPNSTAETYDYTTGLWTIVASPPEVHLDADFASTGDGRAVMVGDFQSIANWIVVYTEASNTWATYSLVGNPMPQNGEEGNQCIQMADGNVLIAGGLSSLGDASNLCYIFNQTSNTIIQTGSMNSARTGAATFLQSNGRILVVGGDNNQSTFYKTAEEYNPLTEVWTLVASTNSAHSRMAHDVLSRLPDGDPFVVGGESSIGAGGITSTEEFITTNMAINQVNTFDLATTGPITGGTPFPLTPITPSAGHLLVFSIDMNGGSGTITAVTDDKGNTWHQVPSASVNAFSNTLDIWYVENCLGGSTTISITSSFGGNAELAVVEYSGVKTSGALLTSSGGHVSTTAAPVTPALTPNAVGQLLFGLCVGNAANITGVNSPWTVRNVGHVATGCTTADYIGPPVSVQTGAFTPTGSQQFISSGAIFQPSTGASSKKKSSMFLVF